MIYNSNILPNIIKLLKTTPYIIDNIATHDTHKAILSLSIDPSRH